jgi:hypothetical protein
MGGATHLLSLYFFMAWTVIILTLPVFVIIVITKY